MDAEQLRAFTLTLPHVEETLQWGANLVFWVGDKTIGGKMFAMINLDDPPPAAIRAQKKVPVLSFHAGPEQFPRLLECEGAIPAPYLARAHWIAILHWSVFPASELQALIRSARDGVHAKLPARLRSTLALSPAQRRKVIAEQKRLAVKKTIIKA